MIKCVELIEMFRIDKDLFVLSRSDSKSISTCKHYYLSTHERQKILVVFPCGISSDFYKMAEL